MATVKRVSYGPVWDGERGKWTVRKYIQEEVGVFDDAEAAMAFIRTRKRNDGRF